MKGNNSNYLSIREFYKGKTILVTGFTGNVGKVLVEKLLYSCPEIEKIYLLIRAKKGMDPQQRIKQITSSRAFVRFGENPSILESKLIAISGDILQEKLGLSPKDESLLCKEINIIFHSAASIRFDEPLNAAYQINTAATKRVVDLALNMNKLICLTYISTAYSNSENLYIKEELYPPPADWRKTQLICDKIDPATLHTLQMKYVNKAANTYTFTKALAEHVVNDYRDKLPVLIVRPSIVCLGTREPEPFYVENPFGSMGLCIGTLLGLFGVQYVRPDVRLNQIPSDTVNNVILAATCKHALQRDRSAEDQVEVVNVCSPQEFNHSVEEWFDLSGSNQQLLANLKQDGLRLERTLQLQNDSAFKIHFFYRLIISAFIIDFLISLIGKKPLVVRLRRKFFLLMTSLKYFTTHDFEFETRKMEKLVQEMSPEDRQTFGWQFDFTYFRENIANIYEALKKNILAPMNVDLKRNGNKLRMLRMMDQFGIALSYSVIGLVLYYSGLAIPLLSLLTGGFFALSLNKQLTSP